LSVRDVENPIAPARIASAARTRICAASAAVFNAFHQLDEPVVAGGMHGREADAAVAHDDGRHAVPARRREALVPDRLAVVVRVDVDEARRHEPPARVDLVAPRAVDGAHRSDATAGDREVRFERRASGAVRNHAAANHEVVPSLHRTPVRRRRRRFIEDGRYRMPLSPLPSRLPQCQAYGIRPTYDRLVDVIHADGLLGEKRRI
jgi:hypothetical protein